MTYSNNFGYAYLTNDYKVPAVSMNGSHLHLKYDEAGYHHDGNQVLTSGWSYYSASTWDREPFTEYSPTLFAQWFKQEKPPQDAHDDEYVFLLNDAPHSNLIIYEDYGNDFNDNRCFDEHGHTNMSWGIWNSVTSKIDHVVGIQYAYQKAGKPMLSVFRRDRIPAP